MCQLDNSINNLLDIDVIRNIIGDDNRIESLLDYYWRNGENIWNEDDVNNYFAELNRKLLEALNKSNRLIDGINVRLIVVMQEIIQDFGSINTLGLESYINYQFILRRLHENNDNMDIFEYMIPYEENMEIKIDPRCPICYSQVNQNHRAYVTPLSSWTKVLAAYDPKRFWIYDARVALALRFLSNIEQGIDHYNWFIPNSRPNLQTMTNRLNKGVVVADQKESYQRYLALLLNQETNRNSLDTIIKTASHFEKRLFMLGGVLRDIYVASDEDEKDAIIAIARANAN